MKERIFRFKQFSVSHLQSAMKVGVDGVLIGAWATCTGRRVLDVGCGCGLIALMIAQRAPEALITAIDIDSPSVEEAKGNVSASAWNDRIVVEERSFADLLLDKETGPYDLIVSNPPFFDSGVNNPLSRREISRHQGSLSPRILLTEGKKLLSSGGKIALIAPSDLTQTLKAVGVEHDLIAERICFVRDNISSVVKRVMMEFKVMSNPDEYNGEEIEPELNHLILFNAQGQPTPEYITLCKDFYLKF